MLQRAQLSVYEARAPRAVKEYAGRAPRNLPDPERKAKRLERELAAWFAENGMSDHVEVNAIEDDHEVRFVIVHGRRLAAPLVVAEQGRMLLPHRPVQCDLLRYEPSSGRLKVSAPYPRLVRNYRESAGRVFFDDADFFENETACSLAPLREHGATALTRHTCAEVEQVRLTYAVWRTPEGDRCTFTSNDCFALMERLNLRRAEGELLEVRLAIKFYGKAPNRVTVTLREPDYLDYRETSEARSILVERLLAELGIWQAERDRLGRDLWGLAAGAHTIEAWRMALGREADRMAREGLLLPARLPAVVEPGHPSGARVLDVIAMDDDPPFLGVRPAPGAVGRPLSPTDVQGYAVRVPDVARLFMQELGLEGALAPTLADGVFDIGRRTFGATTVRVLLALREPAAVESLLREIIRAPEGSVVLIPKGRSLPTGYAVADFSHILPPHHDTLRSIIFALHLENQVEALLIAPPDTRLVVDRKLRRAWLDRTDLVMLKDQPFDFVQHVVDAAEQGRVIPTAELDAKLSKRDAAARQARSRARDAIQKSFELAGKAPPTDLETLFEGQGGGNGWRLTASHFIR
ncbi:Hypothetical protein A7982_11616 [Minicystis rosea]|nr:Hypothetical protein A7982_11616 [Minicystis rosea]